MATLTLKQRLEQQKELWHRDQEYIAAGRRDAFGLDVTKSKLLRDPVAPKTTKNFFTLNNMFNLNKRRGSSRIEVREEKLEASERN